MAEAALLVDTASRIFSDHCNKALLDAAERGEFPGALWQVVREQGLDQLALPETGTTLADLYRVARAAGYHGVPLPFTDFVIANRIVGDAERLRCVAHTQHGASAPWGRAVEEIVLAGPEGFAVVSGVSEQSVNVAGEARDYVTRDGANWQATTEPLEGQLCLGRVAQAAGTLERILDLSLQYAGERSQFGRTLSKFQAIQHTLAVMATEVAAASRMTDAVIDTVGSERFGLEVAAAKARMGQAVAVVAEQAHQVHGAMGFTHEHTLHHFTRRAWAAREEYGAEPYWQAQLGEHLAALGADSVWDFIATRA